MTPPDTLDRALDLLFSATGLLVAAGAGMSVESGLPDLRGTDGFWRAYQALAAASIDRAHATPHTFHDRPRLAWGFYGHRMNIYRRTPPLEGGRDSTPWLEKLGIERGGERRVGAPTARVQ